jgi:hypothetical protein
MGFRLVLYDVTQVEALTGKLNSAGILCTRCYAKYLINGSNIC